MAAAQRSSEMPKPSFAKIAAAVSKEKSTPNALRRPEIASRDAPSRPTSNPTSGAPMVVNGGPRRIPLSQTVLESQTMNASAASENGVNLDNVTNSLGGLNIKAPNLVVNGTNAEKSRPQVGRESGSDESGQADSGSDVGTKPPSIDGKSITSGTTFALDEKESLRPDDSASVKAAAEDDDAFSIRGSLLAGSRMGSEVAQRPRHIHLGELPDRRQLQPTPGSQGQGISTPQSTSSEQPPGASSTIPLGTVEVSTDALGVIYRQAPDEKLLEALATPRDRYFLLCLEKDVIDFVQNSKEPYMDLPPSNSFCRMLTHKLADYYHMTHSFEPHIGSVRIFRTPFCRVPPSLALMNPQPETTSTEPPPPVVLPKKIMRRGQEGGSGASPSKTTSEDGVDGKDGKDQQAANQKLTREQREEQYKLVRERIFGNSEESGADGDDNGMSRASSVSANRSNLGKRGKMNKQRRDDTEAWDSRNQYTPYWGPQQQTWVSQPQPYFAPAPNAQFNGQGPPPSGYNGQMGSPYGHQAPTFTSMPTAMPPVPAPAPNSYAPNQYAAQPTPPRYQPGGSPMIGHGSPVPAQQAWQAGPGSGFAPPSYPTRPQNATGPPTHSALGLPYAFGQLPANANPHDPKSQHPIPGSYNRNHSFNPMTQSFVPGGSGSAAAQPPQPPPPFPAPSSHHSSPQIGTPHLAYAGYQQAMPQSFGGGFGMARQGSSNSMPPYHAPQHMTAPMNPQQHHSPLMNAQHMAPQHMGSGPGPVPVPVPGPQGHIHGRPAGPSGPSHMCGHLPNYGNPATLPQKPGTGF